MLVASLSSAVPSSFALGTDDHSLTFRRPSLGFLPRTPFTLVPVLLAVTSPKQPSPRCCSSSLVTRNMGHPINPSHSPYSPSSCSLSRFGQWDQNLGAPSTLEACLSLVLLSHPVFPRRFSLSRPSDSSLTSGPAPRRHTPSTTHTHQSLGKNAGSGFPTCRVWLSWLVIPSFASKSWPTILKFLLHSIGGVPAGLGCDGYWW